MMKSESIVELSKALSKAQGEIKPIHKNSENLFFKSAYADLSESLETILPVFSKHGLAITQGATNLPVAGWVIQTVMTHSSGEWVSFDWPILVSKQNAGPQDFASSASYARRYSVQAIACAAAGDDDDANKATEHHHEAPKKPYKAPSAPVKGKEVKNYAEMVPIASIFQDKITPTPLVDPNEEITFEALPSYPSNAGLDYTIDFGKHHGKTIKQVGLSVCKDYADWLKNSSVKSGKKMNENVKVFCDTVDALSSSSFKAGIEAAKAALPMTDRLPQDEVGDPGPSLDEQVPF